MKRPKDMSDAEYGHYIREQSRVYAEKAKIKARLFSEKTKAAKIVVTDAEVEAAYKAAIK